jgi:hypothetical protein
MQILPFVVQKGEYAVYNIKFINVLKLKKTNQLKRLISALSFILPCYLTLTLSVRVITDRLNGRLHALVATT